MAEKEELTVIEIPEGLSLRDQTVVKKFWKERQQIEADPVRKLYEDAAGKMKYRIPLLGPAFKKADDICLNFIESLPGQDKARAAWRKRARELQSQGILPSDLSF